MKLYTTRLHTTDFCQRYASRVRSERDAVNLYWIAAYGHGGGLILQDEMVQHVAACLQAWRLLRLQNLVILVVCKVQKDMY